MPTLSEIIVHDFIDVITNRKGLRHVWDNIDEEVQAEIMAECKERFETSIKRFLGLAPL